MKSRRLPLGIVAVLIGLLASGLRPTAEAGQKKTTPPRGEKKDFFILPIDAVGRPERLKKLKAVRFNAKVSFAIATNVNDITIMWCWEPKIRIRCEEIVPRKDDLEKALDLLQRSGKTEDANVRRVQEAVREVVDKVIAQTKEACRLDARLARQYYDETRLLLGKRDYRPFFDDPILIVEGNEVFTLFHKRLSLPLKEGKQATQTRNLFFALSVSNVIPLKQHKFQIEDGKEEMVKGRECRQFKVQGIQGVKLAFFFDKQTNLLAKIAHEGRDPAGGVLTKKEVLWEHFFSDYREAEGIKQWWKLEIQTGGRPFATFEVRDVQYFDEMPPELRRPDENVAAKEAAATETKAAEFLAKAKQALEAKNVSLARVRLQNIVAEYGNTQAAKEARTLLKSLSK